jgi:hypothetical protein
MGSDPALGRHARRVAAAVALFAIGSPPVWAQDGSTARSSALIFSCVLNGKKITSDRPIQDCSAREQRVLNSDGSLNRVLSPSLTIEERGELEKRQREEEEREVARKDAVRRDRNLMQRYPDETAHAKGRAKALDDVRLAVRNSEARIAQLKSERKPLEDEKEFYVGKPLPTKLKLALDANEASLEAQKTLVQDQQLEVGRINALYDNELLRLKKLWAGAAPGSLGPMPSSADASKAAPKVPAAGGGTVLQVREAARVKSP